MKSLIGTLIDRSPIAIGELEQPFSSGLSAKLSSRGKLAMMEKQPTVMPIVDRLASSVGAVKWSLYRQAPSGNIEDRIKVAKHPALTVWRRPNSFQTRAEFVESMQQHYELAGEFWWIVGRSEKMSTPMNLWVVRPDRMEVVKHRTKFIAGYMYGNGNDEVPLKIDDVIYNKRPNPRDPYRGLSPLSALMTDIDAEHAAAEYNVNFFRNGAEPGGMLKMPQRLNDAEFETQLKRWQLSHRGVNNAHRVGILEGGTEWEERAYTMRDMQFEQLRRFSREQIRNAWGFPKALLGDVEDVNRANAEAATVVFANWLLEPRLNRIRESLNEDFLPMFGRLGDGLEFDYDNPTPPDQTEIRADRQAKIADAASLIGLGFDPDQVLAALELPALTMTQQPETGV